MSDGDIELHDALVAAAEQQQPMHQPAFDALVRSGRRRAWRQRSVGAVAVLAVAGGVTAGVTLPGDRHGIPAGPQRSPSLVVVTGLLAMIGGPMLIPPHPYPIAGTVVFYAADGRQYSAQAASDGRFAISLAPGRYTAEGHAPGYEDGRATCHALQPVVVTPGHQVDVVVACQIR